MVPADNIRSVLIRSSLTISLLLSTFLFGGAQADDQLALGHQPNVAYLPITAIANAGTPSPEAKVVQEMQPVSTLTPSASPTPLVSNIGVDTLDNTSNTVFLPLIAGANAEGVAETDEQFAESEVDEEGESGEGQMQTIDDLFAEIARQIPNFGGMFFDESGQLTMYLAESQIGGQKTVEAAMAEAATAKAAIATILGRDARITEAGEIRLIRGQYNFLQLKEWYDRMSMDVLAVPGVIVTDIDELSNLLRIGIENQEVQGVVEEHLAHLDIPRGAVIIEVTEPAQFSATLREKAKVGFWAGGLQIHYPEPRSPTGYQECTMGFIANRAGAKGFVINSHCTNIQGGVERTVYHQPTISGNTNKIGVETVDPTYWTGGKCPAGRRCRSSDAAFAEISVNASVGFIARTIALKSIVIDSNNPQYRVVREINFPMVGETLNKVGRTSGWTQGLVFATCVNIDVLDTDITLRCQDKVMASSRGGDSGSPVFKFANSASSPTTVNVSATTGWQVTSLTLQQGEKFNAAYNSGTWTVDFRNFSYVGPEGYPLAIDQQIYQGCKVDLSLPYAMLLGRVGSGQTFSVGRGGTFTANGSGALYLRINDQDGCVSDNTGSVSLTVGRFAQPIGDVHLYGILWGGNLSETAFFFSSMSNMQAPSTEIGALKTCASGFSC